MITEDYVSAKTASLLKDKGFNIPCKRVYNPTIYKEEIVETFTEMCNDSLEGDVCTAPAISVACKWLREEKDVLITYDLAGPLSSKLLVKVYKKDYDLDWIEATTIIRKTLEEAIDTAIQWSLENLI